jgi:hypothetical protein
MEHEDVKRRFRSLTPDAQLRVLAALGHNLTIAARDTYEFQGPGVLAALATDSSRYPDDDLMSIVLELGDEHVRAQSLRALQDALTRVAS